jgi:hypothetical protein
MPVVLALRNVRLSLTCQSRYPRDTRVVMVLKTAPGRTVCPPLAQIAFRLRCHVRCMSPVCPVVCNGISCPKTPANPVPALTAPCASLQYS